MPGSVVASGESGETLLRVQGLSKRFGRHVVLEDVDLSVKAGELVALVGENGAGKSTLVRCVAGDLSADSGTVELTDDRPPAIVWQDLALCENLDAPPTSSSVRRSADSGCRTATWNSRPRHSSTGSASTSPLHRPVGLLSGGQRQSLAIAMALVGRPRLLILDEPAASLGVLETRAVEEVMLGLRAAGCGLLLISHRIEQVFGIADRVVVLRHGRVVADRPTMELHPDDVVSLIAGIDAETTARKQMDCAASSTSWPRSSRRRRSR